MKIKTSLSDGTKTNLKHIALYCCYFLVLTGTKGMKKLQAQKDISIKKTGRLPGNEHIIIAGVDGMSPYAIRQAFSPVLHQMAKKAAVKWNVHTVLPSWGSPNRSSMFMGAGTQVRGIINNDQVRQDYTLPPVVMDDAGIHKIRTDYYNASGGYWLELRAEGPGLPRQIIFAEMLKPQLPLSSLPYAKHPFIVISHRADHVTAPENSLAAIDSAVVHGADYVELDLRTTIDSSLVIMHDATIDRTTNAKGQISKMPVNVLDTCHLKNSVETIPHFESCLLHCSNKINIYLDFKNADVRQTMEVLTKYHFEKSVLVYINAPQQYDQWRKWAPQIPLIISLPDDVKTPDQLETFLKKYPAEVLDGNYTEYTPQMVARAKLLGIQVWPDIQSANEMNNWAAALAIGFGGLQTDHPLALIQWLQSKSIR